MEQRLGWISTMRLKSPNFTVTRFSILKKNAFGHFRKTLAIKFSNEAHSKY